MTRADLIRLLMPLRLRQLRRAGVAILAGRPRHPSRRIPPKERRHEPAPVDGAGGATARPGRKPTNAEGDTDG